MEREQMVDMVWSYETVAEKLAEAVKTGYANFLQNVGNGEPFALYVEDSEPGEWRIGALPPSFLDPRDQILMFFNEDGILSWNMPDSPVSAALRMIFEDVHAQFSRLIPEAKLLAPVV
jgi:hypothetical protein